ncbi:hypothetical protein CR513_25522, partial [Mucuna pruriens]
MEDDLDIIKTSPDTKSTPNKSVKFVRASDEGLKEFQRCVEEMHLNDIYGGFLRLDVATRCNATWNIAIEVTSVVKPMKRGKKQRRLYPYDYEEKMNKAKGGLHNLLREYINQGTTSNSSLASSSIDTPSYSYAYPMPSETFSSFILQFMTL